MTTTAVTSAATTTTTTTSTASKTLAGNFQTFLTLLTTQLQNQDPTSPMDSNQFTQQLVMYSQVEQQIAGNEKLDSLIALSQNQTSNLAMSYLGKNIVLSDGTGLMTDSKADWTYGLNNDASATTLTVKNSSGKVVYSKQMDATGNTAGTHTFSWDGKDTNGDVLSDGLYTLVVSSTGSDGKAVTSSIASKAQVSGVDLSGTSPQLVIGTSEVPLSSASLVTN
jgi:flagellar basal-body rod modification protein FlgD